MSSRDPLACRRAHALRGQYDPNINLDDQAFIESFVPVVDILSTKQIPRKLVITSLRKDYTFLLKGELFLIWARFGH